MHTPSKTDLRAIPPTKVIAVLCSDLHLSHAAPLNRTNEPSWYAAQFKYVFELRRLAVVNSCPVVCAGDVFDTWRSPPELINWAHDQLPTMYAVPGQHDLPYHSLFDIKSSAYWTLVQTGRIINLEHKVPNTDNNVTMHGFPWGTEIHPCPVKKKNRMVQLAVIHAYCWTKGCNYPGATEECRVTKWREELSTYDAVIFGDNHKGFLSTKQKPHILNCGTFMRRKADERLYKPKIGLLHANGDISVVDNSPDGEVFLDTPDVLEPDPKRILQLTEQLHELYRDGIINFLEALDHFTEDKQTRKEVRNLILKSAKMKY